MTLADGPKDGSGRSGWVRRERPPRLERRLEFPDYEVTRVFLERVGDLSEDTGQYPNLSFGRTYVNLTLFAEEGADDLTAEALSFAEHVDRIHARTCLSSAGISSEGKAD